MGTNVRDNWVVQFNALDQRGAFESRMNLSSCFNPNKPWGWIIVEHKPAPISYRGFPKTERVEWNKSELSIRKPPKQWITQQSGFLSGVESEKKCIAIHSPESHFKSPEKYNLIPFWGLRAIYTLSFWCFWKTDSRSHSPGWLNYSRGQQLHRPRNNIVSQELPQKGLFFRHSAAK